jgi:precorrin-6x reductase
MPLYHLLIVDRRNEATVAAYVQCETDKQAVAEARKRAYGRRIMIWQGDRWVGAVEDSSDQDRMAARWSSSGRASTV